MSLKNIPLDLSNETTGKPAKKTKAKGKADSATNQNLNQSELTQQGNQTKGNTPGGNFNETRHTQANKPRSNPQGNAPMSLDTNNSQKGPGSHGD